MTAPAYSLAAWRKYREEQEQPKQESPAELTLADIPADAEMDDGIVIGFWNGERFVAWEKWLATARIARAEATTALPEDARLVTAVCGKTRVWLARDGDRWLDVRGLAALQAQRLRFAVSRARAAHGRGLVRAVRGWLASGA